MSLVFETYILQWLAHMCVRMCDWLMELGPKLVVLILISKYEMMLLLLLLLLLLLDAVLLK